MVVLAGPNGAGKSTLYDLRVRPVLDGPFVNADLIQRDELRDPSPEASYRAAAIVAKRRDGLLREGRSFATETVFSHPSKLDLIRAARAHGFTIVVMHLGVATPELSVARVGARAGEGGHGVPEAKIRARFERGGPLIRKAVLMADRGLVFDNSALNASPVHLLGFARGRVRMVKAVLPDWALRLYGADLGEA